MCKCVALRVCLPGTVDVKKEGLDDQISRLAKLIGKLEDKVGLCTKTMPFWPFWRIFHCITISRSLIPTTRNYKWPNMTSFSVF